MVCSVCKNPELAWVTRCRTVYEPPIVGAESPAVALSSSSSNEEGPDNKSSNYFTHLDTTIENLQKRTQQVIDKINENRKKDHALMNSFRENLLMKVSNLAEKLEERVFPVYDHHNKLIQDKLQDLSEIMERIKQIETELRQVCHTVEKLYKDLCSQSEFCHENWYKKAENLMLHQQYLLTCQ
uniref:Synaptonemal complex central element protein 2 n=1 Tax=Salvator merianae TaxID=96440 RepID=A0A8D0B6T9_SALMN